jgi:hypothetical protein
MSSDATARSLRNDQESVRNYVRLARRQRSAKDGLGPAFVLYLKIAERR